MRSSHRPIRIASRRSRLARRQAEAVGKTLMRLHSGLRVEYVWVESEGDQRRETALASVGGKGLFARAVEAKLLVHEADVAVHSLKDLPVGETPGLSLVAIPPRADPRDCLVAAGGARSLNELPRGAHVGTASPRRAAQLLHLRSDLRLSLIRGNVDTRLEKVLQRGHYDATLLAAAGLKRTNLFDAEHHVPLDPAVMLPAAAQGALAVQCRGEDHVSIARVLPLNDFDTAQAVSLERQVVAALNGDCHSPIAAFAQPLARRTELDLRLRVRVLSPDPRRPGLAETDLRRPAEQPEKLLAAALEELSRQGAYDLLRRLPDDTYPHPGAEASA